jgi:hypothetical protein
MTDQQIMHKPLKSVSQHHILIKEQKVMFPFSEGFDWHLPAGLPAGWWAGRESCQC